MDITYQNPNFKNMTPSIGADPISTVDLNNPIVQAPTNTPVTDITSLVTTLGKQADTSTAQQTQTLNDTQTLMQQLLGQTAESQALGTSTGLDTRTSEMKDLQNVANQQAAEYTTGVLAASNRVGTGTTYNAEINNRNRQNAINVLTTNALISAKQGQIDSAQNLVDKAIALKYDPIKQQIENKKFILEQLNTKASKDQANLLSAQLKQIEKQQADETAKSAAALKGADTVKTDAGTFQWNPKTKKYDIPIDAIPGTTTTADMAKIAVVNDINNLLADTSFDSTFGLTNIVNRTVPGTPQYALSAQTNNVIQKLSLAARGQLKGQGAVSDFEGKMLKEAQTALKMNLNPEQARKELIKVRGAIMTSSGLSAPVKITSKDGISKIGEANQKDIMDAISSGYTVEYH